MAKICLREILTTLVQFGTNLTIWRKFTILVNFRQFASREQARDTKSCAGRISRAGCGRSLHSSRTRAICADAKSREKRDFRGTENRLKSHRFSAVFWPFRPIFRDSKNRPKRPKNGREAMIFRHFFGTRKSWAPVHGFRPFWPKICRGQIFGQFDYSNLGQKFVEGRSWPLLVQFGTNFGQTVAKNLPKFWPGAYEMRRRQRTYAASAVQKNLYQWYKICLRRTAHKFRIYFRIVNSMNRNSHFKIYISKFLTWISHKIRVYARVYNFVQICAKLYAGWPKICQMANFGSNNKFGQNFGKFLASLAKICPKLGK